MPQERTTEWSPVTIATSLLAGSAIALGCCLLVMALCAWLISRGSLGEVWTARAGLIGAFLGCLVGGGYAIACIRSRALLVGVGIGGLFLLLWLLAGLLFPGAGGGCGPIPLVIASLLGGGLSGILFASRKKRRK